MNIKNFHLLCIVILNIGFVQIQSNSPDNYEKKDPEQFLNITQTTPSQFNAISLSFYFSSLTDNPNNLSINKSSSLSESNMDIFDQSLSEYIKDIYNNKYYNNFLSQDGSHIVEFLKLSKKLNLETQYIYTPLRLFYNKIKSCEIIDDTVTIQILKPLPSLLEKHFEEEELKIPSFNYLSQNIEKILLYKLTDHYQEFEATPDTFISNLSKEVGTMVKNKFDQFENAIEKKEMKNRLRQIVIRFVETLLSKTFWAPEEYHSIWESVLTIAHNLQRLALLGIVDHMDDFDDMLWSLTHRFCYFLDVSGSFLPRSFFEKIEDDIQNQVVIFLELEEQDEDITTKKEILLQAIFKAKTKAIAFERGIFTDQMM